MAMEISQFRLRGKVRFAEIEAQSTALEQDRAELSEIKAVEKTLVRSIQELADIAETPDQDKLRQMLQKVCKSVVGELRAEYCAIGELIGDQLEDLAFWPEVPEKWQHKFENHRKGDVRTTLVGSIIERQTQTFRWDQAVDGELTADNPKIQKQGLAFRAESVRDYCNYFLSSRELRHMLVVPITSTSVTDRTSGYIHIINRFDEDRRLHQKGFSPPQIGALQAIAGHLATALSNFDTHQHAFAWRKDHEFLASLASEDDFGKVMDQIFARLNEKLDARLASFWLPTTSTNGGQAQHLAVLHSLRVNPKQGEVDDTEELAELLRSKKVFSLDACYVRELFAPNNQKKEPFFVPQVADHRNCWGEHRDRIAADRMVVLPILSYTRAFWDPEDSSDSGEVYAVVCLRADRFIWTEAWKPQLAQFAWHISILLEQYSLKRRFDQISRLKQGFDNLAIRNRSEFFDRLTEVIQEVMEAETCGLYLREQDKQHFLLCSQAPESDSAHVEQPPPVPAGGFLSRVLEHGVTLSVVESDDETRRFGDLDTLTGDAEVRSILAAPLVRVAGEKVGVMVCLNKKPGSISLSRFLDLDKGLMNLLAGITGWLIEHAESSQERLDFLSRFEHELATSLNAFYFQIAYVEGMYDGKNRSKEPKREFDRLREEVDLMRHHMEDIEQHRRLGGQYSYDWNAKYDLYPIINRVQILLKSEARWNKHIDIKYIPARIPKMYVDPKRLEQVVFNVARNAIKFSHPERHDIIIRYKLAERESAEGERRRWHSIEVKNWGIPVIADEKDLIFEDYKRGSNAYWMAPSGSGIGLAVSRKIVEEHGGTLEVTRLRNPTIFTIFLPEWLSDRRPS